MVHVIRLLALCALFMPFVAPTPRITHKVFLYIEMDREVMEVPVGLYGEICPQTVGNFFLLAQGNLVDPTTNQKLSLTGSKFHRIIPQFMMQGGDFTRGDGSGGRCVFKAQKFNDENFAVRHDQEYLLSMANAGPNTNGSQFFITFRKTPWLDGKHVVFGRVITSDPVVDFLKKIEAEAGNANEGGKAKKSVVITSIKVDGGVGGGFIYDAATDKVVMTSTIAPSS